MTDVTLPDNEPTRKQRFAAALDLAGLTLKQWCVDVYKTDPAYVYRILIGRESGGVEINAAIDATIDRYLGVRNLTVPRGTTDNDVVGVGQVAQEAVEHVADVFHGEDNAA
jgi:hypothetical protein